MILSLPDTPRKVLVDVDAGTDDAWALFMLLRAVENKIVDIKAITCCHGNTDQENVTQNVMRVLQTEGKEHQVPVYKGCAGPILRQTGVTNDFFHGKNGFGDLEFEEPVDLSLVQRTHAVNAIADMLTEHPKELEVICIGPLTNLALAIRMYGPEVVENIKSLWIMGGNNMAVGNITGSAEFNFYGDPEAAEIVLDSLSCPITIVPWETCTDRFLRIPLAWRLEEQGVLSNGTAKLLNALDHVMYTLPKRQFFKPCDAILTAVSLSPEVAEVTTDWHASVELHGQHTRGQLVLDHLRKRTANVRIVEKVSAEAFKALLLWTVRQDDRVTITRAE